MTHITSCLRKGDFAWTAATTKAFEEIKDKLSTASVLRLPDFSKTFEVACNASGVGIGGGGTISARVEGFERVRFYYTECLDFGEIYSGLSRDPLKPRKDFIISEGYLFYGSRLCVPQTSLWDFLAWDLHAGGAVGHFGRDKTIALVENRFLWPGLKRDVTRVVCHCRVCRTTKGS
ncbi:hypothetical protein KSP39_PZI023109 [Platanthera zijinensis]|uniref:Integrase zinc-binding domain-containing protein n=1 Tax=Platanthera zijinensis TaxID=2320716 RepID=A0AAP0FUZ7_9ASPA